ncbi:hypothetical protein, partial [Halomonas sp. LBP4]|uniref:hypothetical protein n=1 Tax=Halomonas sp. LBP4 TaxID=2044917 RepID=UPI001C653D31
TSATHHRRQRCPSPAADAYFTDFPDAPQGLFEKNLEAITEDPLRLVKVRPQGAAVAEVVDKPPSTRQHNVRTGRALALRE